MTSLAYIPTPAAAVDMPAVDTPEVPIRHDRPALTESSCIQGVKRTNDTAGFVVIPRRWWNAKVNVRNCR